MADVSDLYPKAKSQPNPVETLGTVANIQNLRNQNRLFQQQFNTNLGISQIYKDAIDPQTGQLNTDKLRALLADPNAAANVTLGLPQAIQQSQQAQSQQIGIDTAKLDNATKHLGAMWNLLSTVDPKEGQKGVWKVIGDGIAQGLFTPQQVASEFGSNPIPTDETGIANWRNGYMVRVLQGQDRLNAMMGTPTQTDTGSSIMFNRVSPLTGVQPMAVIPKSLAPGDAASPIQVYNPNTRQMEYITKGQFAGGIGQGAGSQGEPSAAGDAGAPASAPLPNIGTGRYPGRPAAAALGAAPPLGAGEAANVTAHQSAQQGIDLQKSADSVPSQKMFLNNLDQALDKFTSGPGANWKLTAKAFVNANSPFGDIFNPAKIASQEEFNKQALQLAQNQFQQLGGTGTDAKLDSTMKTSPNEALSKMGNKGIIALLKGNADAIQAKNEAWQDWLNQGHGAETYGQFSTQFNKTYDPRVFQFKYLTPEDRQATVNRMTKDEKAAFAKAIRTAQEHGWATLPNAR